MNQLGKVLLQARQQRGLSLRDIQKLSDNTITATYVMNLESGEMIPSPKKLKVLAKTYRLDFLDLMILAGHVEAVDLKGRAK